MADKKESAKEPVAVVDQSLDKGSIRISEDVFSSIIKKFTLEVNHVIRLASTSFVGGIVEMIGKKSDDRPIKVTINDDCVEVAVSVVVEFGANLRAVAADIQKVITQKIELITGEPVAKVDVFVTDLAEVEEEPVVEMTDEVIEE
jgi:uncharacterized alkaline shock family protein YloU